MCLIIVYLFVHYWVKKYHTVAACLATKPLAVLNAARREPSWRRSELPDERRSSTSASFSRRAILTFGGNSTETIWIKRINLWILSNNYFEFHLLRWTKRCTSVKISCKANPLNVWRSLISVLKNQTLIRSVREK